jgi:hypothetical protein
MISERNEAFGVRVYRGHERGYEWVGTFKFRDYGGRRGARKAAEQAEAEARVPRRRDEAPDSHDRGLRRALPRRLPRTPEGLGLRDGELAPRAVPARVRPPPARGRLSGPPRCVGLGA